MNRISESARNLSALFLTAILPIASEGKGLADEIPTLPRSAAQAREVDLSSGVLPAIVGDRDLDPKELEIPQFNRDAEQLQPNPDITNSGMKSELNELGMSLEDLVDDLERILKENQDKADSDRQELKNLQATLERTRQHQKMVSHLDDGISISFNNPTRKEWFNWAVLVVGTTALIIGLKDFVRGTYKYIRARQDKNLLAVAWDDFVNNTDSYPTHSGKSEPTSIATIRGADLADSQQLARVAPEALLRLFRSHGMEAKVTVWASGIQSTGEGMEFSGITKLASGVAVTDFDELKYLATHLSKKACEQSKSLSSFVTAIFEDCQVALMENRWPELSHEKSRAGWRVACQYLVKWAQKLGRKEDAEFFRNLQTASKLGKEYFSEYCSIIKRIKHLEVFPYSLDNKLSQLTNAAEAIVGLVDEKLTGSRQKEARRLTDSLLSEISMALEQTQPHSTVPSAFTTDESNLNGNDFFRALDSSAVLNIYDFNAPNLKIEVPTDQMGSPLDFDPVVRAKKIVQGLLQTLRSTS